jgi:hypothetical protein
VVVAGGFTPIPPRLWALDRRAHALGFPGLRAFLAARYAHAAHSLPQLAAELGTTVWLVRAAMDAHRVVRLADPLAKGRARKAASDRHAAERAAQLGFPNLRAYLHDRYARRAWPLPHLATELGSGRRVVGRLLRQHGITRPRATAAQAAAAARGRARHWRPAKRRGGWRGWRR